MNEALQALEIKVENGGATPQGKFFAKDWNTLVEAVKQLDLAELDEAALNKYLKDNGYITSDDIPSTDLSDLVTLSTEQTIPGSKNFTGGIKVNGQPLIYNAELGVWELTGDLLVTGAVTMFGSLSGFKPSTITDAVLVDGTTIVKTKNSQGQWQLTAIGGGGGTGGGNLTAAEVNLLIENALKPYALSSSIPTDNKQLENGAGYITAAALNGYATQSWVEGKKYLTGITSSQVTTALGFTPYDSTNPDKYIKGINYDMVIAALGYTPYSTTNPMGYLTTSSLLGYATEQWVGDNYLASSNFTKANIKSTLGISDWALAATKPSYTAAEVGALSTSGGSVSSDDYQPLFVNSNFSSGIEDVRIAIAHNWNVKGLFNWESNGVGLRMYNTACGSAIGIKDDGTPYYDSYELIHSGNIGQQRVDYANKASQLLASDNRMMIYHNSYALYVGDNTYQTIPTHILGKEIRLRYGASAAVGMILLESGNVVIGGTTADAKLHVYGNARIEGDVLGRALINYDTATTASDRFFVGSGAGGVGVAGLLHYVYGDSPIMFWNNGFERMRVASNGNVAIGGTTADAKLHVHGDAKINGNLLTTGAITMFSQLSMKKVIDYDGLSLAQLAQIRPARFTWKDGRDNRIHVGGIADEVMQILPEVIYRTSDDKLTMDYGSASFYIGTSLIKPVIDHERRISDLERENKQLKQQLGRLSAA